MKNTPVSKAAKADNPTATAELGATGMLAYSGRIADEFLPQLQGSNAVRVFNEMASNDPIVAAILFAIDMLIREVKWTVTPADKSEAGMKGAEFVESVINDMSHTFEDFVSEMMTMLVHGWAFFEVVYKRRQGAGGEAKSRYDDGFYGVRKLAPRSQDTLLRWVFDENGGVVGFVQQAPKIRGDVTSSEQVFIPITKGLLFRTVSRRSSPQGKSVLRGAYRPWWLKKRLEEGEAIGLYRNLAGLPVAYVPGRIMTGNASVQEKAMFEAVKMLVQKTVMDEQAGVVLPGDRDESGNRMFELTLLASPGTSKADARSAITDYNRQIAMVVLADFIMLGQTERGSFALSVNKTDLFTTALQTWLNSAAAVLNRFLLPTLWDLNGWDTKTMPSFTPGAVAQIDMSALGDLLSKMASAGAPVFPDPELEDYIRRAAGLPDRPEDTQPTPTPQATDEQVAAAQAKAEAKAKAEAAKQES